MGPGPSSPTLRANLNFQAEFLPIPCLTKEKSNEGVRKFNVMQEFRMAWVWFFLEKRLYLLDLIKKYLLVNT